MQCPFCGRDNDKVVDSRSSEGGRVIRRRRQCLDCGRRYTTRERPEDAVQITVLKKDGARQPYDRQKLILGLQKACYKLPITDEQVRQVVEATEEEIFRTFDKEVPSSFIGDTVSAHLRDLSKIAYVRFASVYRNFKDVGELIHEAREAEQAPAVGRGQHELFDEKEEK